MLARLWLRPTRVERLEPWLAYPVEGAPWLPARRIVAPASFDLRRGLKLTFYDRPSRRSSSWLDPRTADSDRHRAGGGRRKPAGVHAACASYTTGKVSRVFPRSVHAVSDAGPRRRPDRAGRCGETNVRPNEILVQEEQTLTGLLLRHSCWHGRK